MVKFFLTQNQGKFIGPLAIFLGFILNALFVFLSRFGVESAAWCIILMTFIINALMIPITVKQQKSSKLQSRMAPELNAIQNKYKGKTDQTSLLAQQAETKAVYDKYGTSALSGCLPMLITLPILYALYAVISNVPAYVPAIKEIYAEAARAIQGIDGYVPVMQEYLKHVAVATNKWGDTANALSAGNENSINYIIDILTKFTPQQWDSLAAKFPEISEIIKAQAIEANNINTFLGMNIAAKPSIRSITVLIPVLSIALQWIQSKLMMAGNPIDKDNPAAATMNTMNNVMPFTFGIMCLFMPIGLGLYWVAGSLFRVIQQIFVNNYMKKMDVDELIEKNKAKAAKKAAKRGVDPNQSVKQVATQRVSTIKDASEAVKTSNKKMSESKDLKDYKRGSAQYDPSSISSIANVLNGKKD